MHTSMSICVFICLQVFGVSKSLVTGAQHMDNGDSLAPLARIATLRQATHTQVHNKFATWNWAKQWVPAICKQM